MKRVEERQFEEGGNSKRVKIRRGRHRYQQYLCPKGYLFTLTNYLPVDLLRGMESERVRVIFGRFGSNFVFLDERGS